MPRLIALTKVFTATIVVCVMCHAMFDALAIGNVPDNSTAACSCSWMRMYTLRMQAAAKSDECREAREEIQTLIGRYGIITHGCGGDMCARLTNQINCLNELIAWCDKCPRTCRELELPPKEQLEKMAVELRQALKEFTPKQKRRRYYY